MTPSVSAHVMNRYEARKAGRAAKFGRVIIADLVGRVPGKFSIHLLRMREIEKVITSRYGREVPETDDPSIIEAVAYAINAHCQKVGGDFPDALRNWCAVWAPWANARAGEIIRPILNTLVRRRHDLHADKLARLLHVSFNEREMLGLNTIGACDIPPEIRRAIVKNRKRKRDRARQAAIREAEGRQNRTSYEGESLSRTKPWEAEGISRRTWYRRRGTGLSRVEIYTKGDTLVPTATVVSLAHPSKGSPLSPGHFGSVSANVEPEPLFMDDKPRRMGGAR